MRWLASAKQQPNWEMLLSELRLQQPATSNQQPATRSSRVLAGSRERSEPAAGGSFSATVARGWEANRTPMPESMGSWCAALGALERAAANTTVPRVALVGVNLFSPCSDHAKSPAESTPRPSFLVPRFHSAPPVGWQFRMAGWVRHVASVCSPPARAPRHDRCGLPVSSMRAPSAQAGGVG